MPYLMTAGSDGYFELNNDPFPGQGGPMTDENREAKLSYKKYLRGEWADAKYLPKSGYVSTSFDKFKPFMAYPSWYCKPEVREVIEALEPNIHQFVPYEFRSGEKGPVVQKYEYINLCEPLDTIDVERCDPRMIKLPEQMPHHGFQPVLLSISAIDYYDDGSIALDEHKIGHRHLWAEKRTRNASNAFISDQLYEALLPFCSPWHVRFFKIMSAELDLKEEC